MYVYFSIMLGAMGIVARVSGLKLHESASTLISFIFVEVFPMLLLASFFSRHSHWIKSWFKFFWRDLKSHWRAILTWGVMLFLIQITLNMIMTTFLGNSHPLQSGNTADFLGDIRQDGLLMIMNILIAPIFEELIFRIFLTHILAHFLEEHFAYRYAHWINYGISVILSAFIFASLHDGLDWGIIPIYMGCAWFLQFIQERTQSLTAPAMVHGLNNLIVIGLALV